MGIARLASRLLLLAVLFMLLPATALAGGLEDAFAEVWTTRDGLPHSTVNAVEQTPDGYLWIATWQGIARYNGREFEAFRRTDIPGQLDDGIRTLHLGPRGDLWAGCARGGLMRLRDGRWAALAPVSGLVTDLLEERDGRLWVTTGRSGVTRIDPDGRRTSIMTAQGLPSDAANALAIDRDGHVWVGSSKGLARVDRSRAVATPVPGLPAGPVHALLVDADNTLLVGTEQGVYRQRAPGEFVLLHPGLARDAVIRIWRDTDGSLWLGTVAAGLARLHDGRLERMDVDQGLPNSRVLGLRRDREGSLWVGTNGGLARLRHAPMRTFTRREGLSDGFVRTVLAGPDGRIWAGTSKGLNLIEPGRGMATPVPGPVGRMSVLSLALARAGGLWVGTFQDGLVRLQGSTVVERLDDRTGLPSNEVRGVVEGRDGRLWIGTRQGLVVRDPHGRLTVFDVANGLPGDYVHGLYEDSEGTVWVGTSSGMGRVRDGRAETVDIAALDAPQFVFAFFELPGTPHIWVGTDRGLIRIDRRTDQRLRIHRAHGLPFEKIFAGITDHTGGLWLTSGEGIARLRVRDLRAVADGRARALEARVFGHSDGLATSQANGGSTPAATLDGHGRVWVATAEGVAHALPAETDRAPPALAALVLESFRADGHDVAHGVIAPGHRRIELRFASPSLLAARRLHYRYHLDGLSPDWVELGMRREVQFTNLAPGRYVLHVQAFVPGDRRQRHDARFAFSVEPHWWQHRAVQIAAALGVVLALAGLYGWRIRQLKSIEKRLRGLVDERTEALQVQTAIAERLARTDPLTGLANRRALDEALQRSLAQRRADTPGPCLLLVDIDHFKRVNDGHSHLVGDLALGAVADVLRVQTRQHDLAARWGGEEFALLLDGCTSQQAHAIAERVRATVASADCNAFAAGLHLTVSIGVACGAPGMRAETLVAQADRALLEAKRLGRNRVVGAFDAAPVEPA